MDLKNKITREVENAKYANQHPAGTAERILKLIGEDGCMPLDFVKWYSGMEGEKIMKAYDKWIEEHGDSGGVYAYYTADGSRISSAWMVDTDGAPVPFKFTEAAKAGYKNAMEYMATFKKKLF